MLHWSLVLLQVATTWALVASSHDLHAWGADHARRRSVLPVGIGHLSVLLRPAVRAMPMNEILTCTLKHIA